MSLVNPAVHVKIGRQTTYYVNTFLIFMNVIRWDWNALPQSYLQSPYLTSDNNMVDTIHGEDTDNENFVDVSHHINLTMSTENELPVKAKYSFIRMCKVRIHNMLNMQCNM